MVLLGDSAGKAHLVSILAHFEVRRHHSFVSFILVLFKQNHGSQLHGKLMN
jgi:hypothetical protein